MYPTKKQQPHVPKCVVSMGAHVHVHVYWHLWCLWIFRRYQRTSKACIALCVILFVQRQEGECLQCEVCPNLMQQTLLQVILNIVPNGPSIYFSIKAQVPWATPWYHINSRLSIADIWVNGIPLTTLAAKHMPNHHCRCSLLGWTSMRQIVDTNPLTDGPHRWVVINASVGCVTTWRNH